MNAYDPGLPWSKQVERCVLILDNARVHDQAAIALIQAAGGLVRLLPPYSPDLNPIEDVFSVGRSWLRRHVTPEHFNEWPFLRIALMLSSISPAMCRGFVKTAVRNITLYIQPPVSDALLTAFSRYREKSTATVCHCFDEHNQYQRFSAHWLTFLDNWLTCLDTMRLTFRLDDKLDSFSQRPGARWQQ